MNNTRVTQLFMWIGFTAILLGYFTVWFPGPGVGLTLIGLEINEWIKFLPQVRMGEIGVRHWFALPPVTLAIMMNLVTATWSNGRWQTWVMRGLGLLISLLALPPLEVIRDEPPSEWLWLVLFIGIAILAMVVSVFWLGPKKGVLSPVLLLLIFLTALMGLILPTIVYMRLQPVLSYLWGMSIGVGMGFILNAIGHGLVAGACFWQWRSKDYVGQ